MARVKMSEYKAKRLLLGEPYEGVQIRSGEKVSLSKGAWVVKVDQGVKKRFKQGLVAVNVTGDQALKKTKEWEKRGFSQFIAEPYFEHAPEEEQYFSLERVREGLRLLHAAGGGIDVEEHPEKVGHYIISTRADIPSVAKKTGLPEDVLTRTIDAFEKNYMAFLEINPLVIKDGVAHLLDAAVLVDSAAEFFVRGSWTGDDLVRSGAKFDTEARVEALAATTPASLKLKVLNPDGALFLLLSGGGGSIVIADEAQLEGVGDTLGNYGEYSGGPTREETYLYAKEVIQLLLDSNQKKKALVIAGGVANFTDVKKTFAGIIDALSESADKLRKAGVKVFVRRGGPNEAAGLSLMREFLEKEQLLGTVYGSDTIITQAVDDAIHFVRV